MAAECRSSRLGGLTLPELETITGAPGGVRMTQWELVGTRWPHSTDTKQRFSHVLRDVGASGHWSKCWITWTPYKGLPALGPDEGNSCRPL